MDVCHVLRNHETEHEFIGPRYLVRAASLEMHPLDEAERTSYLKYDAGIGYCNINKCCTDVCPEHIRITDNAIIPLKERVADEYYDPLRMLWRKLRGQPATPVAASRQPAAASGAGVEATGGPPPPSGDGQPPAP
jgi:succinate dehydrogenase / fumarate reductase iron-sulfur subunit